jgi:hypothetical protein
MTLDFTPRQLSLLSESLFTRMKHIDKLLTMLDADPDPKSERLSENYSKDYMDIESLLQIVDNAYQQA